MRSQTNNPETGAHLKTGSDSRRISAKLEECLDSGYYAETIRGIHSLINHARFLENQVASLKETIARLQDEDTQGGGPTRNPFAV
jgi:hypothetical protein